MVYYGQQINKGKEADYEPKLLEVCVDCMESALAAARGGASRLELCANLIIGGTSPSPYLIREAAARTGIPVNVLLRPRFGDFCYTPDEKAEMLEQTAALRALGASGAVVGALLPNGALDTDFLARCRDAAGDLHLTLHRAFDVCRDAQQALEQAVALGFDTVLTSGQQPAAMQGAQLLSRLVRQADGRIAVMPGSGVSSANIALLAKKTGASAFHLSAKRTVPGEMVYKREGVPMGLPMADEFTRFITDEAEVRRARTALDEATQC